MLANFDFKLMAALLATVLTVVGFIPYLKDMFLKKTKPHVYTWLVWAITQGTATIALWYGGGNYGTFSLTIGTILVALVFLLSFRFGTKNITYSDTVVLITALIAILVWWQLHNPWLSIILVSIIDGLGYIPTFRKSFEEPWSETLLYWALMVATDVLTIISNAQYNFLTVTYLATLALANTTVFIICVYRRGVLRNSTHL